ncbi:hypothetical protein LTR62_001921 [Meristemomyces frigidus]|uniref:Small ribosomal subunit protein mS38 n=1 Tax=Meristemomyces frigidus TaxID=1508187 RepID=A0AAN7YG02_9PEZI|nr:hypothetical protein LTR62_001921 [Meristemomyces frigidus]
MFSSKLTRAAHRATTSTATTPALSLSLSTQTSSTPVTSRPSHQRRPSSSKASSSSSSSCPPDSSKAAPTAKEEGADKAVSTKPAVRKSRKSGYGSGRSSKVAETMMPERQQQQQPDHFAGLPTVPGVQHLNEKDVALSSFFSRHRPISVTTTIPPPTTIESFSSIFSPRPTQDAWAHGNSAERRPEDVIYTLHNTIENLENHGQASQEDGMRWEVIQESASNSDSSVRHLDGAPGGVKIKSLEELVAQFTPFRAPPPPEPFPAETKTVTTLKRSSPRSAAKKQAVASTATAQKSYQTTITILEVTAPDGQQSYSASHSPIVRVSADTTQAALETTIRDPSVANNTRPRTTFMERRKAWLLSQRQAHAQITNGMKGMRERSVRTPGRRGVRVYAISVKRQRKLKMKKHKYKKLMKRTRNLRRRLDRN